MNENIELKSFSTNYSRGSLSEEYHEISFNVIEEEPQVSQIPSFSENDFFIQYENKKIKNKRQKKKNKKKEEKVTDLMDVINTEITAEPLIIKNNIATLDYSNEVGKYLKPPYMSRRQERFINRDIERGYHIKNIANINPIFPCALENTIIKETKDVQVQYKEPALFNDIVTDYGESSSLKTPKFLDIILLNMKFKHHHDFSLEKLLCVKLIEVYKEYIFVKTTQTDLLKNIDINRLTRNNLKEKLLKISLNKKDDARFDSNVLKYTKLMLEYKERYFKMLKREKQLLHMVISLWSDIEIIREKSECKTDYILEINQVSIDDEDFKNEWNKIFEQEYTDLIVKIEYEFIMKYMEYKQSKINKDDDENKKVPKPKLKIDYDKLRTEVESMVAEILPEDKINISLKQDKNILSNLYEHSKSLSKINYLKFFVDNVFVCQSEVYESKSDQWDIDFEECLSIEILPRNSDLKIVLFENDDYVSTLKVNLCDIKKNTNESDFINKEFDYNKIVEPSSKTIGSGFDIKRICSENKVRLKSSNMFKGRICTKCDISIKIGWNEKLSNNKSEFIKPCIDLGIQLKRLISLKDQANVKVLIDVISDLYERKIDNDENIVNKLDDICKGSLNKMESFKFDDDDVDITRFKLLHQRQNGGFVNVQNKVIPLFPTQISTEQLSSLQKNEQKDIDLKKIESNIEMDVIDLQRYIGVKYVEKLNKNLVLNINESLLKKTFKDVVKDISISNWRSEEPLDIISNQRAISKQECAKEQEIYITVFRAFNLSDRSTTMLTEEDDNDENIAGFKVHPLRPFVRASYHGVNVQTATAIGCYPTWNHTMKIKAKFEPVSTIHINIYDECKDNASELYSDENSQSTVYYRKSNKWLGTVKVPLHTVLTLGNIRGAFKIAAPPFTFGYENVTKKEPQSFIPEVSQLFKKSTSFIVLQISTSMSRYGGFKNYNQPIPIDPNDSLIRHLNEFVTEYINDFPTRNISLTFIDSSGKNKCASQFLQPIPLPDYDSMPINPKKAESAVSKSSGYSRSSSSRSSRKKNSITEESLSGFETHKSEESVLIKNMDMAIRYVSLIPTYEVSETHVVTLTGLELLKVLYGSPLDHTILLASFFIHLGIKCLVVIGFGLPRGLSSYVLVKYLNNKIVMANYEEKRGFFNRQDEITWYIYDAVAGERFELRDVGCPLKTVSFVFDCENIWVNMQATEDCESVSFDFSKSSNWQAVFDKPLFVTRPILIESLYSKPADVEKLRLNLETKIKTKVQKWRSHVKTIWNRYCSILLKEMLPHYEYWAFNPTEPRPSPGSRLKQLMATYKIFGFPLNMPYLNSKLIMSTVKSTAAHANDEPGVEFALAVDVYCYPNNVISVWVFLASVARL